METKIKKITAIILALAMLTGLAACVKTGLNTAGESEIVVSDAVTLSIKEGSLTNKCVTVILTNNTEDEYIYGEGFSLEVKENGKWKKIKLIKDFAVNLLAFNLEAKMSNNSSAEQQINWEMGYGELPQGEYRLIKDITAIKDIPLDKDRSGIKYIAVEFVIDK